MNQEDEYSFENLLASAPASVALMGQTVLMTMMGTDASLLFGSYDGHVVADGEGALKIFQWATAIRSDVVHLVLCGCRAIEVGEKYIQEWLQIRNQKELVTCSKIISETHHFVQVALCQAIAHSNEILVQITSFLDRYPRKPTTSSNSPAGSVYTTVELMRQAVLRSQRAFDQLHQSWIKYGRLFSFLLDNQADKNSIHFLSIYLRISRDFMTPASKSVQELLSTIFDSDITKSENAAAAVEKARDELMAAYNSACETIKSLKIY